MMCYKKIKGALDNSKKFILLYQKYNKIYLHNI